MKVITLLNEKGGVGKTTLAIHIAAGLAIQGARVVIIDADPQGSATEALGFQKSPSFYDLLVRGLSWGDALRVVSTEIYEHPKQKTEGALAIVPGNDETRNINQSTSDTFGIRRRLAEVESNVDYVVFDTSPTVSLLHGSIYLATDYIIYPSIMEFLSIRGLVSSIEHTQKFNADRTSYGMPPIEMLGIVPMMYRDATVEHSENLKDTVKQYGDLVWTPVPRRIAWAEATNSQCCIWTYDVSHIASREGWKLVERLVGVMTNGI